MSGIITYCQNYRRLHSGINYVCATCTILSEFLRSSAPSWERCARVITYQLLIFSRVKIFMDLPWSTKIEPCKIRADIWVWLYLRPSAKIKPCENPFWLNPQKINPFKITRYSGTPQLGHSKNKDTSIMRTLSMAQTRLLCIDWPLK